MKMHRRLLVISTLASLTTSLQIPFYGPTANNFTTPPHGWNSFALQAASSTLKSGAGWDFNDFHFRQQCSNLMPSPDFDTVCSIDSGWSIGCNGDENGIPEPDMNVIPNITDLAGFLHGRGLKLGLYILPGAFSADSDKLVEGTSISIGSLFDDNQPSYNCRQTFDYAKDGVQQWHDSVIRKFASWGVDFIKLDFMTPGSPDAGEDLPTNNSGAAIAYHNAIKNAGVSMRLDVSWKLDRSEPFWQIWRESSDSLRVDQDINNSGLDTFVAYSTVLRTLDFYRGFVNEQTVPGRNGVPIMIHPDMDNTFVGNNASISGLSDVQRYTQAIHWLGAGANLITGSDLTRIDALGNELLFNSEALNVAAFTAQFPMQPRNPGTGGNQAKQLQAWIAGPNGSTAVVILANYGPDPCLSGGCTPTYGSSISGVQLVSITLADLGIGTSSWSVRRVWGGGGSGGGDHADLGVTSTAMASFLGEGERALYVLTKT